MKAKLLLSVLVFNVIGLTAQTTKDLFASNSYNYYWLGIDYTDVRLMGDFSSNSFDGNEPVEVIRDKYFPAWNKLVKTERSKFCVEKMFKKDNVTYETTLIDSLNALVSTQKLKSEVGVFSRERIQQNINQRIFTQKEGIGIMLVTEYMDKDVQEVAYWVVAINLSNNEMLLSERFVTKPSGFGIRNYWAGSLYQVFKQVTKTYYKQWKKVYS